eukprot:365591-Chlamydomonas_euryale.AAC.9
MCGHSHISGPCSPVSYNCRAHRVPRQVAQRLHRLATAQMLSDMARVRFVAPEDTPPEVRRRRFDCPQPGDSSSAVERALDRQAWQRVLKTLLPSKSVKNLAPYEALRDWTYDTILRSSWREWPMLCNRLWHAIRNWGVLLVQA